jgi:hypothetical protein
MTINLSARGRKSLRKLRENETLKKCTSLRQNWNLRWTAETQNSSHKLCLYKESRRRSWC